MTPIEAMGEAISDAIVSYVGSTLTPKEKRKAAQAALNAIIKNKLPTSVLMAGSTAIHAGLKNSRPGLEIAEAAMLEMCSAIAKASDRDNKKAPSR